MERLYGRLEQAGRRKALPCTAAQGVFVGSRQKPYTASFTEWRIRPCMRSQESREENKYRVIREKDGG